MVLAATTADLAAKEDLQSRVSLWVSGGGEFPEVMAIGGGRFWCIWLQ